MSRLLALEWDAKEARIIVGRTRAGGVTVEHALTAPLPQREEGAAPAADIGAAIAKVLSEHGLTRLDTLVAVGRSNIELKFLSTPPVPPEELPDLVRFQAVKQFTTLGDDWPLDFVPISPNADGGTNVLAAAISSELIEQINQACTAAGVNASRLVLRPFAAAALLKDQLADGNCRMMVDLLRDDADLTVLIGPQVIFPRTVRLPAINESEGLARVLLNEGRRTMIAAQNQLGGRKVEEIVIFGDGQHHSVLKQLLEKELSLPVRLIDPFETVEMAGDPKAAKPEFPGTFAPLLGMLLDEAASRPPVIDFLHPRKRPDPPNRKRMYAILGGSVAAVVLLGFLGLQMRLWSLDSQIEGMRRQRADLEKQAKASVKPVKDAGLLDQFAAGDITWLDELSRTSEKFPSPEAARVDDITAQYLPKAGAKIKITGVADKHSTIRQIEDSLRDKQHSVFGDGGAIDPQLKGLQWRFDEDISIEQAGASVGKAAPAGKLRTLPKGGAK